MSKPIFKMLVGLSASGKSTYAREKRKEGFEVHSSDLIRMELFGELDNNYMEEKERNTRNEKVFDTLNKRVIKDLKDGKNVIYDATNLSTKRRIAFLTNLNKIECEKECLIFNVPFEECVDNDLNRIKEIQVGRNVIKKQRESFEIPYFEEGWDTIKFLRNNIEDNLCLSYSEMKTKMLGFNQVSKYHNLTLFEHCYLCGEILDMSTLDEKYEIEAFDNFLDDHLWLAANLHDYGKLYTRSYDEEKETCHYYNHENVGAYEVMTLLGMSYNEILDICFFINYHMKFKGELSQKALNKRVKMFGELKCELLKILNKADDNAKLQIKDKKLGEFSKKETVGLSLGINQCIIGEMIVSNTLIV